MGLNANSLRRAILHLGTLGDTDIFPIPFEFKFYAEKENDVVACLSALDISIYTPTSAFECLSPKGMFSFRIAHQLFPVDTLLYTAAVVEIAPSLESRRPPLDSGPFSYRFVEEQNNPHLFARSSSYHDWLLHLQELFRHKGLFDDTRYVLETDISDFYSRIYFHRIEHVLDDSNAPNQVRKTIEKIIKETRAKQSYGLPVGSAASRVLAEALLIDTDALIASRSLAYSRYVDDFRVMVPHHADAHSTLCILAEHLMTTEGLSLNASKTRIYTDNEGVKIIQAKMGDIFTEEEIEKLGTFISAVYDDEDISVEDVEDVDSHNLLEKLRESYVSKKLDYSAIKLILKVLRAVSPSDPLKFIKDNIDLLYHLPRDFCLLVGGLAQRNPEVAEQIAEELIARVNSSPFKEMALSRIWVSSLFIGQALPITTARREALNLTATVIERRNDLLLRGILNDRAFFRAKKTRFDEANDWEKPALMLGASCLPKSEYEVWLGTIKSHISDPTSGIFIKWLEDNQDEVISRLKEDYVIKSRSETIAAMFSEVDEEVAPPF